MRGDVVINSDQPDHDSECRRLRRAQPDGPWVAMVLTQGRVLRAIARLKPRAKQFDQFGQAARVKPAQKQDSGYGDDANKDNRLKNRQSTPSDESSGATNGAAGEPAAAETASQAQPAPEQPVEAPAKPAPKQDDASPWQLVPGNMQ
jgi:hypothetical protein